MVESINDEVVTALIDLLCKKNEKIAMLEKALDSMKKDYLAMKDISTSELDAHFRKNVASPLKWED